MKKGKMKQGGNEGVKEALLEETGGAHRHGSSGCSSARQFPCRRSCNVTLGSALRYSLAAQSTEPVRERVRDDMETRLGSLGGDECDAGGLVLQWCPQLFADLWRSPRQIGQSEWPRSVALAMTLSLMHSSKLLRPKKRTDGKRKEGEAEGEGETHHEKTVRLRWVGGRGKVWVLPVDGRRRHRCLWLGQVAGGIRPEPRHRLANVLVVCGTRGISVGIPTCHRVEVQQEAVRCSATSERNLNGRGLMQGRTGAQSEGPVNLCRNVFTCRSGGRTAELRGTGAAPLPPSPRLLCSLRRRRRAQQRTSPGRPAPPPLPARGRSSVPVSCPRASAA